jgi:hypothetical protein
MQALVWLGMVWFGAALYNVVRFGASYANLRQPHTFKYQIQGENPILHLSKYGNAVM